MGSIETELIGVPAAEAVSCLFAGQDTFFDVGLKIFTVLHSSHVDRKAFDGAPTIYAPIV